MLIVAIQTPKMDDAQVASAMQDINQGIMQSLSGTRQSEGAAKNLNDLASCLTDPVTCTTSKGGWSSVAQQSADPVCWIRVLPHLTGMKKTASSKNTWLS